MNAPETPAVPHRMDRRAAIKWLVAATATIPLLERASFGADVRASSKGIGYGTDPDLLKTYKPGDVWKLTFTDPQRATAAALCDAIIPADEKGPSASSVHVQDFIDEWISAPYPGHDEDRKMILEGLAWLNKEAQKRFSNDFTSLVVRQRNAICDDICYVPKAKSEFRTAAHFFARFRDLTAGGYYTTPEGMKDIGYVGNVPLEKFAGPPPEVLKQLGLA